MPKNCWTLRRSIGDYWLLVGLNAPGVLTGQAVPTGADIAQHDLAGSRLRAAVQLVEGAVSDEVPSRAWMLRSLDDGITQMRAAVLAEPIPVAFGLRVDQISSVDQIAENFDIVATLRLEWQDSARAFSPNTCNCIEQAFVGPAASRFVNADSALTWPDFYIFNQQGRRDTQNSGFFVASDGRVVFAERFTVTLQAPDFTISSELPRLGYLTLMDTILTENVWLFTDMTSAFVQIHPSTVFCGDTDKTHAKNVRLFISTGWLVFGFAGATYLFE